MGTRFLAIIILLLPHVGAGQSTTGDCSLSSRHIGSPQETLVVGLRSSPCDIEKDCEHSEDSDIDWNRWRGITPATLSQPGVLINASLSGEAGTLTCSGTIVNGALVGRYIFAPTAGFGSALTSLGITPRTTNELQDFLVMDITTSWVKNLHNVGVSEMNAENLLALKSLRVDDAYVSKFHQVGLSDLKASQLIQMRTVGITPQEVGELRSMGFTPSLPQLVQIRAGKINIDYIRLVHINNPRADLNEIIRQGTMHAAEHSQ